jgi:hypothetical protein
MDNIRYVRESELNNNKNEIFSNLNSRHVVLMNKITDFYSNKNNLNILLSVIEGKSSLSLRVIDYFVTNYAREKEIIYDNLYNDNINEKNEKFMVYYSYKSQLKAYSKKQFDPFCRRERLLFYIDKYNGTDKEPIRTTIGQLNFFRWAIQNNILDYIDKNYKSIEIDMNKVSKYKTKITKKIKNKIVSDTIIVNDLLLSATKKVNKHNIIITVKFN